VLIEGINAAVKSGGCVSRILDGNIMLSGGVPAATVGGYVKLVAAFCPVSRPLPTE
jgi:hypothetical protein